MDTSSRAGRKNRFALGAYGNFDKCAIMKHFDARIRAFSDLGRSYWTYNDVAVATHRTLMRQNESGVRHFEAGVHHFEAAAVRVEIATLANSESNKRATEETKTAKKKDGKKQQRRQHGRDAHATVLYMYKQ